MVNSVSGKKNINTRVCVVSSCYDEIPLASIKQPLVSITDNAFRHCPTLLQFLKQLYTELWEHAVGHRGKERISEREKERKKSVSRGQTNESTKDNKNEQTTEANLTHDKPKFLI